MNKIPNLMDSPEQFANVSHSTSHSVKLFGQFLDPHDINLLGSRALCDSVTKFHPKTQRPLWPGSGLNQDFSF